MAYFQLNNFNIFYSPVLYHPEVEVDKQGHSHNRYQGGEDINAAGIFRILLIDNGKLIHTGSAGGNGTEIGHQKNLLPHGKKTCYMAKLKKEQ